MNLTKEETYELIPRYTKESLDRYVNHRIKPGGFLTSVLENDLMGAIARADINNSKVLKEITMYVYNELPSNSCGSKQRVKEWLNG